jgi:fatty acid synthase subunit alpha
VLVGSLDSSSGSLQTKRQLFESIPASINYANNWAEKYKPRLLRNASDGQLYVETKFSRLLGKQPVMVAGMTPCTVDGDFVAACINAGYHIELAGGAHYNEKALRQKIDYIMDQVTPGSSVSLNVLYINPKQWGFQFPLACTLRGEGVPIEGFTIAAGIPSLEKANEVIHALRSAGVRHVAFKPGSVEGILQVVSIANQNKDCPIVLQWTGGRAGGHHSFEDFHQPILDTYPAIRSCDNIILVGGSGFGNGEETFPYLDGSWSLAYQYEAMPFDGILFGSRMMVAKEGKASLSVKQTIVDAAGIHDEKEWVKSYKSPVGGVVTVISELGEPIHKIATRGVMLWKELDETVFKLPKEKRVEYLRSNKARIMKRLNDDFQKPWFGVKFDGSNVDLHEMTYSEVLHRLGELLFVKHQHRWIDKSYRKLFFDFFYRVEERLSKSPDATSQAAVYTVQDPVTYLNPIEFLNNLTVSYDFNQLMSSEDCLYFVALCRRLGQKPVPFIPVLDESFETWFKKDSLWQSEDIDAVMNQDPQRVCILQGPVAVKHSKKADEPVKEILDNIVNCQIDLILNKFYGGSADNVPTVSWFGTPTPVPITIPDSVRISRMGDFRMLTLPSDESARATANRPRSNSTGISSGGNKFPSNQEWLTLLVENSSIWFHALLFSDHIVQGKKIVTNTIKTLFYPQLGWTFKLGPDKVEVFDSFIQSVIVASISNNIVSLSVTYHGSASSNKLSLQFTHEPRCSIFPLHEEISDRSRRIKEFYWSVWFPKESMESFNTTYVLDPLTAVFSSTAKASPSDIRKFCRIVGNSHSKYAESSQHAAPMDFAIVIAWEAVIKCLFPESVDGDLLKLVHLSNSINYIGFCEPIQAGDTVLSYAEITSIKWTPTGKIVEVEAICKRQGEAFLKVKSNFFFRGVFDKSSLYFEKSSELIKTVLIKR